MNISSSFRGVFFFFIYSVSILFWIESVLLPQQLLLSRSLYFTHEAVEGEFLAKSLNYGR